MRYIFLYSFTLSFEASSIQTVARDVSSTASHLEENHKLACNSRGFMHKMLNAANVLCRFNVTTLLFFFVLPRLEFETPAFVET